MSEPPKTSWAKWAAENSAAIEAAEAASELAPSESAGPAKVVAAVVPGSTGLTWECTHPSPDYVWSLGKREGLRGHPAVVKDVRAFVERTAGGKWRWVAYTNPGSILDFEPSRDEAMRAAESALPNVATQTRPAEPLKP